MRMTNIVEIDAPAEVIFEWIADGDRVVQWVENLESDEPIEEVEGHVGTRFRQKFNEKGRNIVMEGEVLEWEQDRRVKVHMTGRDFDMTLDMTIEPIGGTRHRVTQNADIRMKGCARVPMFFLGAMVRKQAAEQGRENLNRLSRLCVEDARSRASGEG